MNKKRAGIIDNIMRVRIRDAKFVIADLTHDNSMVRIGRPVTQRVWASLLSIFAKRKNLSAMWNPLRYESLHDRYLV